MAALFIWHASHRDAPTPDRPANIAAVPPETAAALTASLAAPDSRGPTRAPVSTAGAFAYAKNHPATPLPAASLAALENAEGGHRTFFDEARGSPFDAAPGRLQTLSRGALCGAIVSAARANDLPVAFFANLIWQESSFENHTVSPKGALGIAQFIPETAIEHGLTNPFEPVHALFAAAKLLRKLNHRFGNHGLAAAAYNAGPQRVSAWLAERRTLPSETRAYVLRITGRTADQWASSEIARAPDATPMPAKAPCPEVAAEVKTQAKIAGVAKLMAELAAATAPPQEQSRDSPSPPGRATQKRVAAK